jgi:hypothetical protein
MKSEAAVKLWSSQRRLQELVHTAQVNVEALAATRTDHHIGSPLEPCAMEPPCSHSPGVRVTRWPAVTFASVMLGQPAKFCIY